ncbi:MAG TPA: ATP-binding protein [Magnetospirillaceae bacterium]
MNPPADSQLVHWLALLGQNVAMGMVVVTIHAAVRPTFEDRSKNLRSFVLGLLFGLSAVVSMAIPVEVYSGIRIDQRLVFILIGSMFGGPIGAVMATVLPLAFRIYQGGVGETVGIVAIFSDGVIGLLIGHYSRRLRIEIGGLTLVTAGLTAAISSVLWIRLFSHLENRAALPVAAEEALILISPCATVVLGSVLSLAHPRVWRRTERLLADVVATTSDLIWESDARDRFTFVSERYVAIMGFTAKEIIGKTAAQLGWAPIDQATQLAYERASAEHKPFNALSFVQETKNGESRLISVTGRPVFTGQGRYTGYRGVASDVTEIEKWRALIARITDGIGATVGDEFLRTLVQVVAQMLEVRVAFVGRFNLAEGSVHGPYVCLAGQLTQRPDASFGGFPSAVVAQGKPVIISNNVKTLYPAMHELDMFDGVESYAAVPLMSARGEVLGLLGVADGRPRESMQYIETVLTLFAGRAAAEISRGVSEEEARLDQQRAAQLGKMEALGNLAGGIAHDFNNLLGAILGFGQFLVEDLEDAPEQRHYAERIVGVSQRGRSLVQQILTFSRSSAVEPTRVDLDDTIGEIHDLLRATLPSTTQLVVDNYAENAAVFADKAQLVQVMVNLCVNGSDALASEPGTIHISISRLRRDRPDLQRLPTGRTKPSPAFVDIWRDIDGAICIATGAIPPGDCLSFTVADTGTGIPDAIAGHIFEPFRTTKGVGRGTGLGLAVVHRIVREHGGGILVRSIKGKGTRFEIFLPSAGMASVAAEERIVDRPVAVAQDTAASILVVDDDVDYCDMVKTALTRLGHRVDITNDPRVALGWVRHGSQRWDVLVTDQTMPYIRGHDLIRGFKALSADIRCIVCTGYSSSLNEQTALAAGADAFMTKPIDVAQLGKLVANLVRAQPVSH